MKTLVNRGLALTLFVAAAAVSQTAAAQSDGGRNFDVNRLRPASSVEGVLNVESAFVPGHLKWDAMLWFDYADDPLVIEEDGQRVASLVKSRADAHFVAALSLLGRLQISLDVPVTLDQTRGGRAINGLGFTEIEARGLGDLGLTPKLRLLDRKSHGVDLAALARFTIATGSPRNAYLGETRSTITPELALSTEIGSLRLAANLAFMFRENVPTRNVGLNVDHELILRGGASYGFGSLSGRPIRAELSIEAFTPSRRPLNRSNTTGAEWLGGLALPLASTTELFLGGGTALAQAYSVADYRFFGGLRFFQRHGDADKDKIEDSDDSCPSAPEDVDGFEDADGCPDLDNDGDGILDADDEAPNDAEDLDGFQDADGVPDLDNDNDGIPDTEDAAPNDAEDPDGFEDEDGSPDLDNDGDGVADVNDAAPDDAEDVDGFQDEDGAPDPDNDGDTILDADDQAPNQPEDLDGFQDADGIPDPDNDGDGVIDGIDNCPNEAGLAENAGCMPEKKQLVVIKGCRFEISEKIFFATGADRIATQSYPVLDNIAEVLSKQPQIKSVRVEGHTDSSGAAETNQRLSQQRADAVKTYLVSRSVAEGRLNPVGLGEVQPIQSNSTSRGRAANRRVEFIIEDCKEVVVEQ